MQTFERLESEVRSYCRSFPTVFQTAVGHELIDERGTRYLDFFAGAGALNYGHNNPLLRQRLIEYIESSGVTHSLDMATTAKRTFLETLEGTILKPRGLAYKTMFPGPTGTNAVEAALKLARKITGRSTVVAFTNAFHGMTLGSLSLTGNEGKRAGAGVPLANTTRMPFAGYLGPEVDTIELAAQMLRDQSSGVDLPAAFVVETVQAEGGVNVAPFSWLRRLEALARSCQALLIVDDIQVGCGRTGPFFSFEPAGIRPDIICLSKSLSGFGIPLAVTLLRPELDQWEPGEHNGTFRGHNLAFVTATAALERYWQDDALALAVARKADLVRRRLEVLADTYDATVRGRGLIQGLEFDDDSLAGEVSRAAFERKMILETAGPRDEVVKLLPPLTIAEAALEDGLDRIEASLKSVFKSRGKQRRSLARTK